jgi:hypothetical protein
MCTGACFPSYSPQQAESTGSYSLPWFTDQAMRSKAETNQGCTKDMSVNFLPSRPMGVLTNAWTFSSVLNTMPWKYIGEVKTDPCVLNIATRCRLASGSDLFNPETRSDIRPRSKYGHDGLEEKFCFCVEFNLSRPAYDVFFSDWDIRL